jgi:TonB family protein
MLKPDSTRYPRVVPSRTSGPEWFEPDSPEHGISSTDDLAASRQEDLPADFALDLRLHDILEEARVVTAASGAVIAVASGDKMICRAASGDTAPSVGSYLNTSSGLSGTCIQSREMQLCDDTLADPRVNAIACRDLEIRSILALPVLEGEKLCGVLEVFSSVPRAFSDPDIEMLQSFCGQISDAVREAVAGGTWTPVPEVSTVPPDEDSSDFVDSVQPELVAHETSNELEQQDTGIRGRDYRTTALTAAVIGLAVLLGWMVGRVGWSMAVNRAPTQLPMIPEAAQATAQVTPERPAAPPPVEQPAGLAKPVAPTAAPSKPAAKPKVEAAELVGGLVVYEHGKVVFRMAPPGKTALPVAEPGAIQSAARREDDSSDAPVPPGAESYVLERVDPKYPEEARQQNIQGPVVLNAWVGTDGSVRELKVISGDPHLVKAAEDAVQQWRFQPHHLKGQPVEFETRITVNFALP